MCLIHSNDANYTFSEHKINGVVLINIDLQNCSKNT